MSEADQLLNVTVISALGQLALGLPRADPVATLLPELLANAGLYPSPAAAPASEWQLAVTNGAALSANRSLAEQGIESGAVLHLRGLTTARRMWTLVVRADRQYFDSMTEVDAEPMQFPGDWPQRLVPLTGAQMRIGRRGASGGSEPDIDLSGPPADFGVSRQHAVLLAQPDGSWTLVDQGSASGTRLNGVAVAPHQPAPLHDGDEISLGRWSVLTIGAE
jgi:FHA domain/WXG100 protein secretion system (Wss), protein YukD